MTFSIFTQESNKGKDDRYPVYIRIYHRRQNKYIKTIYRVPKSSLTKDFTLKDPYILKECTELIKEYELKIKQTGNKIESWSADQLKIFLSKKDESVENFIDFFSKYINKFDKKNTKYGYKAALNHLISYAGKEINPCEITKNFILGFDKHLVKSGVGDRGRRVYITLFNSVFEAIKEKYNNEDTGEVLIPNNPFKNFEIPKNTRPKKRNIDKETILKIKAYNTQTELEELGKDVFFISFLLCGTNAADLYIIEKEDNRLFFERTKTKDKRTDRAFTTYNIEPELIPYIEKYKGESKAFDFSKRYKNSENFRNAVNDGLKRISDKLNIKKITTYYARHSWATIARNKCGISKDDIALCLNHSTGRTVTDDYIEVDLSIIDKANREVINFVFGDNS